LAVEKRNILAAENNKYFDYKGVNISAAEKMNINI
jgi:hypothetical protein